eukprot:6630373-Heterocapsa_arctica.AAC.1
MGVGGRGPGQTDPWVPCSPHSSSPSCAVWVADSHACSSCCVKWPMTVSPPALAHCEQVLPKPTLR